MSGEWSDSERENVLLKLSLLVEYAERIMVAVETMAQKPIYTGMDQASGPDEAVEYEVKMTRYGPRLTGRTLPRRAD
jgi:hypothetical protein